MKKILASFLFYLVWLLLHFAKLKMVQCSLCCCISLKTGCKIIAILQIVSGTLLLILSTILLFSLLTLTYAMDEDELDELLIFSDLLGKDISTGQVFSGILVFGTLTILFASILWKGVRDNKEGKVRVWIYANFAAFILSTGIWVVLAVLYHPTRRGWLCLVFFATHFYCIIVAYAFMRRVHAEKKVQLKKGCPTENVPNNSNLESDNVVV